jgi:hypothetical protein
VRNVQKTTTYFLPIFMVIIGSVLCINLNAQEQQEDTLKPISNFRKWVQNILPTPYTGTKNKLLMPMAVGYTDFDDNIRDLQLMGKLEPEQSLTQRPYILTPKLGYDSLLSFIDPEFENLGHIVEKKHTDIQLLPINFLQKFNSHHPYGWNDGPLSFSKGYQFLASGGIYIRWRNIHLTLMPEYFKTASDSYETSNEWGQRNPALTKLIMGQSSLRMNLGPLSIGLSSQNLWLGPGKFSSLLMSNNAQGFNHFSIANNKPLKTPIGSFEFIIFGGTLTTNSIQGFENKYLKNSSIDASDRYLNAISISYNPIFFKNLFLGANRAFQQFSQSSPSTNLQNYYLIALKPLFRNQYKDDGVPIDQLISGFVKYVFPKENAEIYYEYGWNDGSSNARDLTLEVAHSAASIFGLRKITYLNSNSYLSIEAEATKMAQSPGYLQRNAHNWYEHGGLSAGYTNENQIMGAGSGFGNNIQTIALSWNKGWSKYGVKFQHIAQQPMRIINNNDWLNLYLGTVDWHDYSYGVVVKQKYKKLLFNLNIDWVYSNNYMWQEKNIASNIYVFLNTIYLW